MLPLGGDLRFSCQPQEPISQVEIAFFKLSIDKMINYRVYYDGQLNATYTVVRNVTIGRR